jgi:hypothetical protein
LGPATILPCQESGADVTEQSKSLSHKFMGQLEKNFQNLPKPLKWWFFYNNDLPILMDTSQEVQEVSDCQRLNKSKIQALEKARTISEESFKAGETANSGEHFGQARKADIQGKRKKALQANIIMQWTSRLFMGMVHPGSLEALILQVRNLAVDDENIIRIFMNTIAGRRLE